MTYSATHGREGCVDRLDNVEAYHVENFGCRASRSDGEAIAAGLRDRGLFEADGADHADVVVLNTCSVTAEADRTARAFVRRVRRNNPRARIVVTGCYAQRAPQEMAHLEGVEAVVGNSHKALVPQIAAGLKPRVVQDVVQNTSFFHNFVPVGQVIHSTQVFVDESFAHSDLAALPFATGAHQTRPNLKVQDGCNNRCSFCIIPETRGPSRSAALETCMESVRRFADGGGQELVVTGINLGRWGRDLVPARSFVHLVRAILCETSLPRLRLSSIEPMDWTPELLALFGEYVSGTHPRLAPHAHLPLQSGSDWILRKMHRRYRPWHYAERLAAIRGMLPHAAIGADVMVGFPGETDPLFQESYDFVAAQPLTYLHLFPFSPRPGTPGWGLHRDQPVPTAAVQERMAALRELGERKNRDFRSAFPGAQRSAVTLIPDRRGVNAITDNFIPIEIAGNIEPNRLVLARITALTAHGLAGTLADEMRSIA